VRHHERIRAYSEDPRRKIVEAAERGMSTSEAACTFWLGHLLGQALRRSLPRGPVASPKEERPGARLKLDERSRKLLEADLEEHPASTLPQSHEFSKGWPEYG
jgi:transposase